MALLLLAKNENILTAALPKRCMGWFEWWAVLGSGNNATIYNLDLELGTERHR